MAVAPYSNFTGDGTTDTFTHAFDVLGAFSSVIVKTKKTSDDSFVTKTEGTHYTYDPGAKQVTFLTAFIPESGELVRIERYTTRDRTVDYIGGSTLREANLDNDANRLTSVDQEIEADILDALRKNDAGDAWNGEDLPSEDCAPATSISGWVTLGQLEARLQGTTLTELTEPIVIQHTGDGVTTEFELSGVRGLSRAQADVYIEWVYQSSYGTDARYDILDSEHTAYPSGGTGDDYISFATAPGEDEVIEIKVFTGQALGVLPEDFVDASAIAPDSVGLAAINVGAGAADRLMTFNASGDPTAELVGLEHLLLDPQTISSPVRAALVNPTTGIRITDFNRAPNAALPLNGQKITDLGTPTANSDAATKKYVDDELDGLVQTASGVIDSGDLPTAEGGSYELTLGFRPRMLFLGAKWGASLANESTWTCCFSGTASGGALREWQRGPLQSLTSGAIAPALTFTTTATGVQIILRDKSASPALAWSRITYFAMR